MIIFLFRITFFSADDIKEICTTAKTTFIKEICFNAEDHSDEEQGDSDSYDLDPFDPGIYGCGEITKDVEEFVEDRVELCKPLKEIFGSTASESFKSAMENPKEESECAAIRVYNHILHPAQDQKLVHTCTEICYWCCCESLKKVSPIIAEATFNLLITY